MEISYNSVQYGGCGGLEVGVLVSGTRVRGYKPGRNRRIFRAKKFLSTPSFGGEVKPSVSCRKFTAWWGSLASFQTWGTPGGGSWNVLITGPSGWGGLTCRWQRHSVKTFLLRIFNDSWAGSNPQGLQCRLKKFIICFLLGNSPASEFYMPTRLSRWNRQIVPKRWHIKFRRPGITQKKAYNIQNTAKV